MKTRDTLYLLYLIPLFFASGCGDGGISQPQPGVTIVKFKDHKYINNLLVYDNKGLDYFSLTRGNECEYTYWQNYPRWEADSSLLGASEEANFPESHRYPFWALPDGWYLIDWAWGNLEGSPYPYVENVILTDVTYENFYEYGYHFDKSLPHIFLTADKMYERKFIKIGDLMAYMYPDGNYQSFELHYYNTRLEKDIVYVASNQYFLHKAFAGYGDLPVASNVQTCLCSMADQMDAYWAVLQNQLATLINNGDLNNLKHFDTNTLYIDQ